MFLGSYGLPKPWYFPLTKSYWCGHGAQMESDHCGFGIPCFGRRGLSNLSVMEEDQAGAMDQAEGGITSDFFVEAPL